MKKIHVLFLIMLVALWSCSKETFYDKFVPEILYFQNDKVENADFKEIVLAAGATQWTVKARVSAPMKLKEIKLFKVTGNNNEVLLQTYSDFQLSPTVFTVKYNLENISEQTMVKLTATDMDNKSTVRNFLIKTKP